MGSQNKADFFAVPLTPTGDSSHKTHHRSPIPVSNENLPILFTKPTKQSPLRRLVTLRQAFNAAKMETSGPSSLLPAVSINDQSSTSTKPTPKKRKVADPTYVPVKNEYSSDEGDDEQVDLGLKTPKQTPRKRKASSATGPSPTPKRKRIIADTVQVPSPAYTPTNNTRNSVEVFLRNADLVSNPEVSPSHIEDDGTEDETNRSRRAVSEAATDLYSPVDTTASGDSQDADEAGPPSPLDLVMSTKKRKKEDEKDTLAFIPHHSDEEKEEDDAFRVPKNEKTGLVFDFSVEKARRWAEAINLPDGVFNDEESDLFFRLAMRGFEPLVPRHWKYDFPTLPDLLFPSREDKAETLIQALEGSNFYGVKSLSQLFTLGGRVRDCRILNAIPEVLIMRHVKRYIRWAIYDARVRIDQHTIPLYTVYAQKRGESTLSAVKKLNQRLQNLASRYQERLNSTLPIPSSPPDSDAESTHSSPRGKFPLLVGFVICGPIIAILTLGTDPENRSDTTDSKFISQFDLSERGQDVWNSLAIAITVMHMRRTMIQLAAENLGGYSKLRRDSSPVSDEDL